MSDDLLPIHGFVLAGGKSSRMGQDKALLPFCGVPLVKIAVAKQRSFCESVSILGSRDDLTRFAPVVHDLRSGIGPGAAFETATSASRHVWSMLLPVDVPLVPAQLLRRWAVKTMNGSRSASSLLIVGDEPQPAFAMLHKASAATISHSLDQGKRRLNDLLVPANPVNVTELADGAPLDLIERWFSNVNTPQELAAAEAWAQAEGWQPPALG